MKGVWRVFRGFFKVCSEGYLMGGSWRGRSEGVPRVLFRSVQKGVQSVFRMCSGDLFTLFSEGLFLRVSEFLQRVFTLFSEGDLIGG